MPIPHIDLLLYIITRGIAPVFTSYIDIALGYYNKGIAPAYTSYGFVTI